MDLEDWTKIFEKSQDDEVVKAALAKVGVKKIPKLDKDDTDVRFDVKGHGVTIIMTDEAFLMDLPNQDLGEGPLIMSGVLANLYKNYSRDLYKGPLPYDVRADMTQADVRKLLGTPSTERPKARVDVWQRDGLKIVGGYSRDFKSMQTFGLTLPRAE